MYRLYTSAPALPACSSDSTTSVAAHPGVPCHTGQSPPGGHQSMLRKDNDQTTSTGISDRHTGHNFLYAYCPWPAGILIWIFDITFVLFNTAFLIPPPFFLTFPISRSIGPDPHPILGPHELRSFDSLCLRIGKDIRCYPVSICQ